MKKDPNFIPVYERTMTEAEFLASFNANMPEGYPHVTLEIMKKFKAAHPSLFKSEHAWNLDQHRKRMIEWLPQHVEHTEAE